MQNRPRGRDGQVQLFSFRSFIVRERPISLCFFCFVHSQNYHSFPISFDRLQILNNRLVLFPLFFLIVYSVKNNRFFFKDLFRKIFRLIKNESFFHLFLKINLFSKNYRVFKFVRTILNRSFIVRF